ncbi:MAG TPA: DUF2239 family protein [Rhodopseudomonas sp.]|uniref:DUF2239 family protein n=1 Tax=Rhodopseudomonas sp. TaxID=1078 RepID=UPI002ED8FDDF
MFTSATPCVAFHDDRQIAEGALSAVARLTKPLLDQGDSSLLIFDATSSELIQFDIRGSIDDVLARLPAPAAVAPDPQPEAAAARGPGRPKLGVVAREVTLLPRHWEWLAGQRGGASVALRRLIDEARHANKDKDRIRHAQESAYRFIAALGENKPHYEEVARALFAGDADRFARWTAEWPADVRDHARRLAAAAFDRPPTAPVSVDPAAANR